MIDKPVKKWRFNSTLDVAMKDVFRHLGKAVWGPFRILYSEDNDALYLQVSDKNTGTFASVVKVDRSGNVSITGTMTQSATLENPGRI